MSKRRGVKTITHYSAPKFFRLTDQQIQKIRVEPIIWKLHTRFYKLADEHYGDPEFWWAIPWFNKKNLESDFKIGDIVHVPLPLEEVVKYFRGETSTGY